MPCSAVNAITCISPAAADHFRTNKSIEVVRYILGLHRVHLFVAPHPVFVGTCTLSQTQTIPAQDQRLFLYRRGGGGAAAEEVE